MLKTVLRADKNKSAKQPQNTATQTVNFFEYKKVPAFCFAVFCGSYIGARYLNRQKIVFNIITFNDKLILN